MFKFPSCCLGIITYLRGDVFSEFFHPHRTATGAQCADLLARLQLIIFAAMEKRAADALPPLLPALLSPRTPARTGRRTSSVQGPTAGRISRVGGHAHRAAAAPPGADLLGRLQLILFGCDGEAGAPDVPRLRLGAVRVLAHLLHDQTEKVEERRC